MTARTDRHPECTSKEFVLRYFKASAGTSTRFEGGHTAVTLPTREQFNVDPTNTSWDSIAANLTSSGQLYLYSGHFLTALPSATPETSNIVASFWAWTQTDSFQKAADSFYSWDHGTALRIEAATYQAFTLEPYLKRDLNTTLSRDIQWAIEPGAIKPNNHGVFLLGSLLLITRVWDDLNARLPRGLTTQRKQVHRAISSILESTIRSVYGDDYWCGENSPMYDRVWINLLTRLESNFEEELSQIGALALLRTVVRESDEVSRAQLLPIGKYVPRGDTPRVKNGLTPARGSFHSKRVGIWIKSEGSLYVMATSGHTSIAHKHVDETAVYLAYEGIDIFLDAGYHSYDYSNPKVLALRTAIGHSALGLDGFDHLPPWVAYREGKTIISGKMPEASANSVLTEKHLTGAGKLSRNLTIVSRSQITVTDSWDLQEASRPVARFLLANNATVDLTTSYTISISRLGVAAILEFDDEVAFSVHEAEARPPYRGWYSTVPNVLIPGRVLEVRPKTASRLGRMGYKINLSKATK